MVCRRISRIRRIAKIEGFLHILVIVSIIAMIFSQSIPSIASSETLVQSTLLSASLSPYGNLSTAGLGTFAFYYVWYGTPAVSGYWYHWNGSQTNPINPETLVAGLPDIAATDYPLIGAYDSNNETLIAQQILWAKQAGIGCFIISWWGINDFTDNATRHVVKLCERNSFMFAFYYETTSSINQTINDISYLVKTYGNSPSFFKINQRPAIFVYSRAREDLSTRDWIWHGSTDATGIDQNPNTNSSAATNWMPAEQIRSPPRLGIIPFQPFKTSPGYVENSKPITLPANEQFWLNAGVSDIRNDSGLDSQVGIKILVGQDPSCNETLADGILNFEDGWKDWSFNITRYAGHDIYIKAESYSTNWQSAWAALDYFYVNNSAGTILNSDPFFDNGWKEAVRAVTAAGLNPYLIMDFGGYEGNLGSFMDYYQEFIDGIHTYNPTSYLKLADIFNKITNHTNETTANGDGTISNSSFSSISTLYAYASQLAHAQTKAFIATVAPGFNNSITPLLTVNRQNGTVYQLFWQNAIASNPDGYAVTSFNEWHEGTELEPSLQYGDRYLNDTLAFQQATIPEPTKTSVPPSSTNPNWTIPEIIILTAIAIAFSSIVIKIALGNRSRSGKVVQHRKI